MHTNTKAIVTYGLMACCLILSNIAAINLFLIYRKATLTIEGV